MTETQVYTIIVNIVGSAILCGTVIGMFLGTFGSEKIYK